MDQCAGMRFVNAARVTICVVREDGEPLHKHCYEERTVPLRLPRELHRC